MLAVLLNWRRPQNIPRIIASLPTKNVVVWDNARGINRCCYGRFLACRDSDDVIITQDDDQLVWNWDELLAIHSQHPDKIVAALQPYHMRHDREKHWGRAHEVLLGWGSVFHSSLTHCLDRYLRVHGETYILRREADRIFTILCEQQHIIVPSKTWDLPGSFGGMALSRQGNHWQMVARARREALAIVRAGRIVAVAPPLPPPATAKHPPKKKRESRATSLRKRRSSALRRRR